jgi:hypothetical protein
MPEFGALSRASLEALARHDFGWADTKCSMCYMRRGCASYLGKYYCLYCLPIALKQAGASTGTPTPTGIP